MLWIDLTQWFWFSYILDMEWCSLFYLLKLLFAAEVIDLYANQLSGRIPSELANLPRLRKLDLHDNNLTGTIPKAICDRKLPVLIADCLGFNPEVKCDCCTVCCRGLPEMKCKDIKTGQVVIPD